MLGTKVTTQILIMNTTKPDKDTGFCIYATKDKVFVLLIETKEFLGGAKTAWIKKLLGENLGSTEVERPIYLQGVYRQFSDPNIDIFIDDDGIGKGFTRTAVTPLGVNLYGNIVILGSNGEETTLLGESQVAAVMSEMAFIGQDGIERVVMKEDDNQHEVANDHPQAIKDLLNFLINYCKENDAQMLSRATDTKEPDGDIAIVMCLHGKPDFIDGCYKVLTDYLNSTL